MIICNYYFQESEISGGVRLCRTGVCIQCDAGLCKAFFHVSCAQANGLLSEPTYVTRNESMNMHSADAVMDAYLAHCKVHTGKEAFQYSLSFVLNDLLLRKKEQPLKHFSVNLTSFSCSQ